MKKKVFSLMMMLLLAVTGFVRADELTVNDGTQTTSYLPVYGLWADTEGTNSEFVIPAAGLAAMNGGEISGMTFYLSSSATAAWTATWQVYLAEVSSTTLSGVNGPSVGTVVYEGALDGTGSTMTVTFDTPYTYNGGNLLIGSYVSEAGNYKSASFYGVSATGAGYYQYESYSGLASYAADFMAKTTFTYTPGEGGDEPVNPDDPGYVYTDGLHVMSADGTIDTVNVGSRPLNAWMAPYVFKMYNESNEDYTVTVLDFTPNDGIFENLTEVPYELAAGDTTEITIKVNATEAGVINRQFVAIYEGTRLAHIWPITAEAYTPECPDVVEVAYDFGTIEPGFEYVGIPAEITPTELHNDYTLPYPEIPEGVDGVYKMKFDKAVMLSARVSQGENGKVALYTEDFYGEEGPMATNNYTDPMSASQGGGGATGPFEAVIGDETSTTSTSYVPYYQLYYNSISESLFTAEELSGAGVTRTPMTSLSWYANADASYEAHGIKIWMANVSDTELTTTSHLTSGMTLVYQGDIQPVTGWNEFVFNQGSFAWDGQSNVIVCVLRNDSEWHSGPTWKALNAGFVASAYNYSDGTVYNSASSTYTVSTMQNRPIIKMKGGNRALSGYHASREGLALTHAMETVPGATRNNNMNFGGMHRGSQAYGICIYANGVVPEGMITFDVDDIANATVTGDFAEVGGMAFNPNTGTYYVSYYDGSTLYEIDAEGNVLNIVDTDYGIVSLAWDVTTNTLYSMDGYGYLNITDPATGVMTDIDMFDNQGVMCITADANGQLYGLLYGSPAALATINKEDATVTTIGELGANCNYAQSIAYDPNTNKIYWAQIDDTAVGNFYEVDPTTAATTLVTANTGEICGLCIPAVAAPVEPGMAGCGPQIDSLNVLAGTYYLVASSTDPDFEVTINIDELPCPESAIAVYPVDNAQGIEPNSVTLKWQLSPYCTEWRLVFSSTYWPDDEPNNPFTIITDWSSELNNTYTVTNLFNNTNYFWRIDQRTNGGEENGGCTTTGDVFGFTTHFNNPHNLTASDETIFEGQTVTLTWNAVVDRTYRQYRIYKDGEVIGTTAMNQINATSFVVPATELTYNMEGYEFYVTALYDEGESDPSNSVNVKVSGYSNETGINGYAYEQDGETPIADVTVTITGTDEFGDEHVYTATTDENGYYHVQVYVGNYTNAVANKEGYQTTVTNHELPFDVALNGQVNDVNFIMDENFVAPAHVCAELVEVNGEELVKVWWDFDFYTALIEDFETGDLSKFDWVNSANYPWTVVTTSPYEGTYCLKSGGAGVASVQSDLSVTVDVPNDGKISFFVKPSCEQNWDYGYFYIDGTQKGQFTGAGSWAEKKYDITAGEHTFKWSYQKDGSVNANDDCIYVDYITFNVLPDPPVVGNDYNFDNGLQGWTNIDADGDGYIWVSSAEPGAYHNAGVDLSGLGHNDSEAFVLSGSYTNAQGMALHPDNYLVSPQVQLGGMIRFYAQAQDASWAAEHFGVAVSTTSNTDASAFTTIQEWTMTAKGVGRPADGTRGLRAGEWYEYTVDLSAYSGMGYVAIRHFNCTDQFILNVDDITIGDPAKGGDRALNHYNIYRTDCYNDGPYNDTTTLFLATVWRPDTAYFDVSWPDAAPGVYKWGVSSVYAGNRVVDYPAEPRESDIVWSNMCSPCIDKDMAIDSLVTVNVLLNSADSPEGTVVTFTNLNEGEQAAHPMDPITLDATGFYRFPSFRKGDYTVTVEHNGYETITDTPVSIWEPVDLRYVMIEILYGIDNLYVSRTGWAMWDAQGDAPTPEPIIPGSEFSFGFEEDPEANGWTIQSLNATTWVREQTTGFDAVPHEGQWQMWLHWAYGDQDEWLITPEFAVPANANLQFWTYGQMGSTYGDHYYAKISTDGGSTWTELWDASAQPNMENHYSTPVNVDLSAYAGQNVKLAWQGYAIDGLWYAWCIDDITVSGGREVISFDGRQWLRQPVVATEPATTLSFSKDETREDRHLEYFKVMCESIDHEPIFNANTTHNFCQVATDQLVEGEQYICKVAAVYSTGQGPWSEVVWQYESCENYAGTVDGVTVDGNTISWTYPEGGDTPDPDPDPEGNVTLVLSVPGDPWQDGTGYQMILDADHNQYGNQIPASGNFTAGNFNEFEYTIPEDAVCDTYTNTIVLNGSATITIPAGVYDYAFLNPYPGGTYYISSDNGNFPGRGDDYEFLAGKTYTFTVSVDLYDQIDLVITDGRHNYRPEAGIYHVDAQARVASAELMSAIDARINGLAPQNVQGVNPMPVIAGGNRGNNAYACNAYGGTNPTGWITYDIDQPGNGTSLNGGISVFGGDLAADGYVYATYNDNTWKKIDPLTGTVAAQGTLSDFFVDCAFDYTTNTMYGSKSGNLYTWNLETNAINLVGSMGVQSMQMIACDLNGQLYGIEYSTGNFDRIDKTTGAVTIVGSTGQTPQYVQGGGFDHNTGKLYWAGYTSQGIFAEVNVNTGAITMLGTNVGEQLSWCVPYTYTPGPTPVEPSGNILGAMIFVDGEWEAFVAAPTNTYTYEGEGENICVRMVYDGTAELPDNNFYYAMSCEECVELNPEPQGCAPVENLTGYYQNDPEYGEAIFVEWDEPEGVVSYELYIGGELAGTLEPGGLPVVIYGLEGYPAFTLPIGVVAVYDDCESEMVEVNVNYDEVPENNLEVALFPNPTKDNVTIQAAGMNHITVMSVLGQVVYDAEVSSDEVILNMSQFNAGVYVVRIVTANGVGTRRVTVVK